MPGGDGTGPGGMGAMTGRAVGYCAGYPTPGFMNPMRGDGFWGGGRGRGGWGRRNWFQATGLPGWQRTGYGYPAFGGAMPYGAPAAVPFAPTVSIEQETEMLKAQVDYFEDALVGIKKRIEELATKET